MAHRRPLPMMKKVILLTVILGFPLAIFACLFGEPAYYIISRILKKYLYV